MKKLYKSFINRSWSAGMKTMVLAIILSVSSCFNQFPDTLPDDYTWKPVMAFPIGSADFGLIIPHGFDTALLHIDPETLRPYWNEYDSIPLNGGMNFDFEEILGKREEIELALIRFNVYNGFPEEIRIQVYLHDKYGNVLDSLFDTKMEMARCQFSKIDNSVIPVLTQKDVYLDADGLDLLTQTREFIFRGNIVTMPYFPSYSFTVQLAAELGIITEW